MKQDGDEMDKLLNDTVIQATAVIRNANIIDPCAPSCHLEILKNIKRLLLLPDSMFDTIYKNYKGLS